jgi:hypothetical protein
VIAVIAWIMGCCIGCRPAADVGNDERGRSRFLLDIRT